MCILDPNIFFPFYKVPELFYLPEVLTNLNSIDFGTTQLGGKIGMCINWLYIYSVIDDRFHDFSLYL